MLNSSRLFELRTYHATPGKFDDLQARFRDHTVGLFAKHGMDLVGFWSLVDSEGRGTDTIVYLLAFAHRAAADLAWAAFRSDPEWITTKAESEVDGSLTVAIESVFLAATDFSPMT
ncbi:MAG: NIPSNAP family protein [Actinomycetota bacterium]|jgi:hypothetical protein|nr:NIPSNAP family protein [Actinomycetota bacterium]